jgi:NADH-quinone oxidoreductase subunit H
LNIFGNIPALADVKSWPSDNFWIHWVFYTLVIIIAVLTVVMGYIYMERRLIARMQSRLGPNRTGPWGLLQPVADAVKVLLKEDIIPDKADKLVYWLAPIVAFFPVLLIFAVVPFANGALLADLNIGILYVLAVSSLTSVGVFMAGWSSNNKYSLLGAMRNIAALVSYELPLMLSTIGVVIITGSLSLNQIVLDQNIPNILLQPLGFLLFFIGGCAEINRSPFDLLEADSELVAGHHTEYSGMKFAMFYLVEYAEALALSAIIATFFLSGWKGPLLPPLIWFLVKVFALFAVMIWTRATLPRVRIDQLMGLAWKGLLPIGLINLIITGIEVVAFPNWYSSWLMVLVNWIVAIILITFWARIFKIGWLKLEIINQGNRHGGRNGVDSKEPVPTSRDNSIS